MLIYSEVTKTRKKVVVNPFAVIAVAMSSVEMDPSEMWWLDSYPSSSIKLFPFDLNKMSWVRGGGAIWEFTKNAEWR